MSKVADTGWACVEGRIPAPNGNYGACQSNARQVVERALGIGLYTAYPVPKDPRYGDITAATAETAWRAAGLAVASPLPGDLIYGPGDSPAGHCAVYLGVRNGTAYILENTYARRGVVVGAQQYIRLTPLSKFGPISTVIRFPEDPKTPEDARQPGTGAVVTTAFTPVTPSPSVVTPPPRPQAGSGLVGAVGESPHYRDDPSWLFNILPIYQNRAPAAVETNLGTLRGTVVLRTPFADEVDFSMPFLGPFAVGAKAGITEARRQWETLKRKWFQTESWGEFYAPLYDMALAQDPSVFRYPVPGVVSINVRQDAGGVAVAQVDLHITEAEHAEAVLATLTMANLYKSAMAEVWLPLSYYDPGKKEGERSILYPAFVGVLEEVSAAPFPSSISFRVVTRDQLVNARGMDPKDGVPNSWGKGTPLWKIIEDIGNAYHINFVTPSALGLSDLKQLQATVGAEYNSQFRPPLDVVKEIVEKTAGLQMVRITGLELFGAPIFGKSRGIWMIYDPLAFSPLAKGFWKNQAWTKLFGPVAQFLIGNPNLVGEVAVFYPASLAMDPGAIKTAASVLSTYADDDARKAPLRKTLDTLSSIAAAAGIGSGPAVKALYDGEVKTTLIDFINELYASADEDRTPTQKWLIPTLEVQEFTARNPTEAELARPVMGTPFGQTGQRGVAMTAERAARQMQVGQAPDGGFYLQTPNGVQEFDRKDDVFLYFSPNQARPSLVVPVNPRAEVADALGQFYPYTVRLRCKPTYGVRVGQVAVLFGMGRLDGHFEVSGCEHILTGDTQELLVTLRTARNIYLV